MNVIGDTPIEYGLHHPVLKTGGPWLVVDSTGFNWKERAAGLTGTKALDIHYDGDDPCHEFLGPDEWYPLPNRRKLSTAYNAPYRRSVSLKIRRTKSCVPEDARMFAAQGEAAEALSLARLIRAKPDEAHIVGGLEYYPNGSVWKDGERWVRITHDPA